MPSWRLRTSCLLLLGLLVGVASADENAPLRVDPAAAAAWRQQVHDYIDGMRAFSAKLRRENAKPELQQLKNEDRIVRVHERIRELDALDGATRHAFLKPLIDAVNKQIETRQALRFTGGSEPGKGEFRPGYGDYDMQADGRDVDRIVQALRGILPAGVAITDKGDYIAVDDLRLTIFRSRPAGSLDEIASDPASLVKAAADKEVYLHLRLPPPEEEPASTGEKAYKRLVTALEIEGHIKKGIPGLKVPAAELLDASNLELLQTTAKAARKTLSAAGLDDGEPGGITSRDVQRILDEAGFALTANQFFFLLEGLKGDLYLDPGILPLNAQTIGAFQRAVAGVLEDCDHRATAALTTSLATLNALSAEERVPWMEQGALASRLFQVQQQVNREKLAEKKGPEGETLQSMIEAFALPGDFDVMARSSRSQSGPVSRVLNESVDEPAAYVAARGDFLEQGRPGRRATIEVAVFDYGSPAAAKAVVEAFGFPEAFNRRREATDGVARQRTAGIDKACAERSGERKEMWNHPPGSTSGPAPTSYGKDSAGIEASRMAWEVLEGTTGPRGVSRTLRRVQARITFSVGGWSYEEIKDPPPTRYQYRWRVSAQRVGEVVHGEVVERLAARGRFVLLITLEDSRRHEQKGIGVMGVELGRTCDHPPAAWSDVEQKFLRLAGDAVVEEPTIRVSGPSGEPRSAVCADGVSSLTIDITSPGGRVLDVEAWTRFPGQATPRRHRNGHPLGLSGTARSAEGDSATFELKPDEGALFTVLQQGAGAKAGVPLRLAAKVVRADGKAVTVEHVLRICPTPVVLLHGVWGRATSMEKLAAALRASGWGPLVGNVDWGEHGNCRGAREVAASVEQYVLMWLDALRDRGGMEVRRVDVVAHSFGGLIARTVLTRGWLPRDVRARVPPHVVRRLVTLATPHQGSCVADWYADRYPPSKLSSATAPSREEYDWFLAQLRELAQMKDPAALEFGPAVLDLRSSGAGLDSARAAVRRRYPQAKAHDYVLAGRRDPVFVEELEGMPLVGPPVEIYVIAGTRRLLGEDYGFALEDWCARFLLTHRYDQDHFFKTLWRKSPVRRTRFHPDLKFEGTPWTIDTVKRAGATSPQAKKLALVMIRERKRYPLPGTQAMVSNLLAFFGMAGTDGVVDVTSALPPRLHGIETRGRDEVAANHFSITEHDRAIELALHYVSGGHLKATGH